MDKMYAKMPPSPTLPILSVKPLAKLCHCKNSETPPPSIFIISVE
jgi:hypothetical protein